MAEVTPLDLSRIRSDAEAATLDSPAGWWRDQSLLTGARAFSRADRDHVANCSPTTVLAMCDRIAELERALRSSVAVIHIGHHEGMVADCQLIQCKSSVDLLKAPPDSRGDRGERDERIFSDTLADSLLNSYTAKVENEIRLNVRERPRWMPRVLYVWLVGRVVIEQTPLRFSLEKTL